MALVHARDKESAVWGWLKGQLPLLKLRHHVHRVENAAEVGDPDVEGCIDGRSFHIELKVAERYRADGSFEVRIKSEQAYWAHRRVKAGGRSWVLIRAAVGQQRLHYLIPGDVTIELFEARLKLTHRMLEGWSSIRPDATGTAIWLAAIDRI